MLLGALVDDRHLLLECPALADVRIQLSQLIADCSDIMTRLVWFGPAVGQQVHPIGLLLWQALMWCQTTRVQTLFHPFSFVGCQG